MHVIFVTFGHAEGCLCNLVRAFICVFVFEVTTKSCGCISTKFLGSTDCGLIGNNYILNTPLTGGSGG